MLSFADLANENLVEAKRLLGLPADKLYQHWLEHVAVDFWHGQYVDVATERGKKMCFGQWKKSLVRIVEAPKLCIQAVLDQCRVFDVDEPAKLCIREFGKGCMEAKQ